mgnify:CR=1 FL=1
MSETKLRIEIGRYLEGLRRRGMMIYWLKTVGSSMQRAGTPDWHITFGGHSLWLEAKAKDGVVSPLQENEMAKWKKAGATVAVVRSVDDVKKALGLQDEDI